MTLVNEHNNIADYGGPQTDVDSRMVSLLSPELAKVTRFRFLSDPGFPFWDFSYGIGITKDGETVRVGYPDTWPGLNKRKSIRAQLVELCKAEGIYAKGLGLLDAVSYLN